MTNCLKKVISLISLLISLFMFSAPALAAAPDGNGPWADTVVATSQGLRNNGTPVLAVRSDPAAALGVAEQTNADGTFYSLGFGGSITLGFVNGIHGGSMVFESTNLPYPIETAKVELSSDGSTWVNAGNVSRTGTVSQPAGVSCAKFVRITDTSDKSLFEPTADGYDVDGVKALGDPCTPPVANCCDCGNLDVTQNNSSSVMTIINSNNNTGKNHANGNTGGSVNITTGGASNSVTVSVTGNTNIVSSGGSGCCNGGGTNITISGNGAGSHNSVEINKSKLKRLTLR